MFLWNGKIWWASEQDVSLVYIQNQEINSVLTAYGTDQLAIYPLFAQPSIAFQKVAQTKLWDKPGGYQFTKFVTRLWGIAQYYSNLSTALNISIDNETNSNFSLGLVVPDVATWLTAGGLPSTWTTLTGAISIWLGGGVGFSIFAPDAVSQSGVLTGFTLKTNAADMAIVSMMIHDEIAGYRG
jgi:hypothetical protein